MFSVWRLYRLFNFAHDKSTITFMCNLITFFQYPPVCRYAAKLKRSRGAVRHHCLFLCPLRGWHLQNKSRKKRKKEKKTPQRKADTITIVRHNLRQGLQKPKEGKKADDVRRKIPAVRTSNFSMTILSLDSHVFAQKLL